jgi:hypothetical protein
VNESFTLFWDYIAPENEVSIYLNAKRKEYLSRRIVLQKK